MRSPVLVPPSGSDEAFRSGQIGGTRPISGSTPGGSYKAFGSGDLSARMPSAAAATCAAVSGAAIKPAGVVVPGPKEPDP